MESMESTLRKVALNTPQSNGIWFIQMMKHSYKGTYLYFIQAFLVSYYFVTFVHLVSFLIFVVG